jgi:8-oxo-dGTP pyrophosphatase MutT (NUDIX family)
MLQRTQNAAFLGGAYVFAGGALDAADDDGRIVARVRGLSMPTPPVAYWVAAIRECFEEAGVLLACDAQGQFISAERAAALAHYRTRPFVELLQEQDLYLPASELAYCGHWITAPGRARRFDTRFFVAAAPEGQAGSHDDAEMVHHIWITPREALERGARGEIELVHATREILNQLKNFPAAGEALRHIRALK